MTEPRYFTPRTFAAGQWRRVRIPIWSRTLPDTAITLSGDFPLVENGEPVRPETPTVRLHGRYRIERAACGLRCRCDARIYQQQ